MSSILEQLEVKPVPKSKERVKIVKAILTEQLSCYD